MRILLTNNALSGRAGTELYLRDLTTALAARGLEPVVFSPQLGEVAEEIRAAAIPVVDDLARLEAPPRLIHGQHHLETVQALLHFPGVPSVYFCHGWLPWVETPPRLPRILRYVAVDATVRDRIVIENGLPEDRVVTLLNFVDLDRFRRRDPLPARPRRALVFSNAAREDGYVAAVRRACDRADLPLDVLRRRAGQPVARPEEHLPRYDLVFAKARSALEAMACGCAVILCDGVGAGPLVTQDEFEALRRGNFGIRCLREPVTTEWISAQIARYDAADAAEVSARLRACAGREPAVDAIVGLYEEVVAEFESEGPPSPAEEGRALAAYLGSMAPVLKKLATLERRDRRRLRDRTRRWLTGAQR